MISLYRYIRIKIRKKEEEEEQQHDVGDDEGEGS